MPVNEPEKVAGQLFSVVWDHLATYHLCDSRYSAEFVRVKAEWFAAGCPVPLAPFITKHANASPEVKS